MSVGVWYAVLAMLFFAIADTVLKKVSKLDWYSLAVYRIAITSIILAGAVMGLGYSFALPGDLFGVMAIIAILGATAYVTFILGMRFWKASLVSAISTSNGLLVVLLSFIVFGTVLLPLQYIAIAAIFLGMFATHIKKGDTVQKDVMRNKGFYFALITFFLWGITFFLVDIPNKVIGAIPTVFYFEFLMLVSFLFILPWKSLKPMSLNDAGYIGIVGIFTAIAGILLLLSMQKIGAGLATSIQAGVPLAVLVLARVWLKEKLDPRQYLGLALIVAGLAVLFIA